MSAAGVNSSSDFSFVGVGVRDDGYSGNIQRDDVDREGDGHGEG